MLNTKARQYLEAWFAVPSSKGFSAYRTGWLVHLAFSVLLAEWTWVGLGAIGATAFPLRIAGSLFVVFAAWGGGALLGIVSHYNPLVTLLAIVGVLASYRLLGDFAAAGLLLGIVAHAASLVFLSALQRLRKVE